MYNFDEIIAATIATAIKQDSREVFSAQDEKLLADLDADTDTDTNAGADADADVPAGTRASLYRGLARAISSTDVPTVLAQAGLAWKAVERPLLIQGLRENRAFPGVKALVRSDTGQPIGKPVNTSFRVHQNSEIIAGLLQVADAGEIKITNGGLIRGGEQVFLHGSVNRTFELPTGTPNNDSCYYTTYNQNGRKVNASGHAKGDITRLDFNLSGGHQPGTPTTLKAMAMRLACLNGATVTDRTMEIRITHRNQWTPRHTEEIRMFVERATTAFRTYQQKVTRLATTRSNNAVERAYVLELMQPDLVKSVAASASANIQNGADLLDSILTQDAVIRNLLRGNVPANRRDEWAIGRSTKTLLANLVNQAGHELSEGNMTNPYNAVTHFVDHVQGRGAVDAAVESAISGAGAKLKERALNLAVEYVDRLEVLNAR